MMMYVIILVPFISGRAEVRKCLLFYDLINEWLIHKITSPSPQQENIKVFSNYDDGLVTFGKEELVTDYMELSEDPKGE